MDDGMKTEEGAQAPSDDSYRLRLPVVKFIESGDWRDYAMCKSLGTKDFFGEIVRGESRRPLIARAVAVCQTCTVRKECFNFAKKNGEVFGVWGGVDFFVSKKAKNPNVIPDSID
jgi:WhiB family redox-sensing transcriptional regulator